MGQEEKKNPAPPAPEQTVTITLGVLEKLIEAKAKDTAKDTVATILSGKTYDESMAERMDQMRGKNRPVAPEEMIRCRSPLTGGTFTARAIKSRSFPAGRIVEILDYERPTGCTVHKDDGGLYEGQREWMNVDPKAPHHTLNKGQHKYLFWLYSQFWQKDWNAVSGKPVSFLEQWRLPVDKAAE